MEHGIFYFSSGVKDGMRHYFVVAILLGAKGPMKSGIGFSTIRNRTAEAVAQYYRGP